MRSEFLPKLVARLARIDSYGLVGSGRHVFVGTGQILDASRPEQPKLLDARLPVRKRAGHPPCSRVSAAIKGVKNILHFILTKLTM